MKKINKLFVRLIVVVILIVTIYCGINIVLKIKHSDKFNSENEYWNWTKENDVIYKILSEKYPAEGTKNFPVIMLKDHEIPEKKENEKRILAIGDSYVYGYGGDNFNYTWWKQLDLEIKKAGYSNVNVYGAGKHRFNTKDELEKILKNEDLMKRIDPDLIIIGYVPNDPEERAADNFHNLVKEDWEEVKEENPIYKKNPSLYYELVDRMNSLDASEEELLKELGEKLGFYRWDIRNLIIVEGERFERYKNVLKDVDNRIKELDVPYFYLFLENLDFEYVRRANNKVYNAMKEMSIDAYYEPFNISEMLESVDSTDSSILYVNPKDLHPGLVWNVDCAKKTFDILKNDYGFLLEDAIIQNIDELELNINDTSPYLKVNKIGDNVFEFEYPKIEDEKTVESNFLYYPIEKNYIKLNLEYPKEIKKIILIGDNLKEAEIYVNTIDRDYGFDIDAVNQKIISCKKIGDNTYSVNKEITSINISAILKSNDERKLRIEFVE